MNKPWTVADAKARLSEVMERARTEGPQTITKNGKETAVLVSVEDWNKQKTRKGSFAEFLLNSPMRGADIDISRPRAKPRDIDL